MNTNGRARTVPIHKMHGCGNDFVFIDNWTARVSRERMACWARAICRAHTGVGADGLVFLDRTPADWIDRSQERPDYIWHFYNADGSRAGMCGNASRCAALLAARLGLAGPKHVLGTDAGLVHASVDLEAGEAEVELTAARDWRDAVEIVADGQTFQVFHVDTGVPHAVVFLKDALSELDVARFGAVIRHHACFAPAGANVNFAAVTGEDRLSLRTFERGVEAETLACGTGAAATALVAHRQGLCGPEVRLTTSGGEVLGVRVGERPFLRGRAVHVFSGELSLEALGL